MADPSEDYEKLLREIEAMDSPRPAQPAPVPVSPGPSRDVAKPDEKSPRVRWTLLAAAGGALVGFVVGLILGFLPWVDPFSTAIGAALGAAIAALVGGPPDRFK